MLLTLQDTDSFVQNPRVAVGTTILLSVQCLLSH